MCGSLFPRQRQVALHPEGERNVAAQPKTLVPAATSTPQGQFIPTDTPSPPGMELRDSLGAQKPFLESVLAHPLPFHLLH